MGWSVAFLVCGKTKDTTLQPFFILGLIHATKPFESLDCILREKPWEILNYSITALQHYSITMYNYFISVIATLLTVTIGFAQSEKPLFTQLDVFELEWATDPQISPDGRQIAYLRSGMDIMTDRRVRSLWIMDADGANHRKLTSKDGNEGAPRWSPDGTRIAYTTAAEGNGAELYVYWLATGQHARISQLERSPSGLAWSPDGTQIAFSMRVPQAPPSLVRAPKKPRGAKWAPAPRITDRMRHEADGAGYIEPGFSHYFVIPAEGGSPRQITSGNFQHRGTPQWTPDGKALIFSANRQEDYEYDSRNSDIYRVSIEDGTITQLTDRPGPDYNPVISPDGNTIAYLGYFDSIQTYQLPKLSLMQLDGSGKRTVPLDLDRQLAFLQWDQSGSGLYFLYDSEGNTKIGHLTLEGQFTKVADDIGGTSVARPYGGGSYSVSDGDVIATNTTTPEYPAEVAVVRKGESLRKLSDLNGDLLPYRQLGEVEEIWYNSSYDDRRIQGWIVRPPNFDPNRKYPLIVENHGGPIANYGDRFSPEMQLYASAGYVVFYPNPRGSTSYGEEFGNLLYHNYPGQDYDDVISGVDAVLDQGYVHEDSLFVTGGSAGGIMTAWIIGKTDRFRAAAVIKPVMNWYSKTLVADNWNGYYNYRYPGYPWENPEIYLKFSPISLVGNVTTPTLVMVGMEDLRTPTSEAKQLYHALKMLKQETLMVEIPGAYHFIANRPSQLITKIDHIVAWFNRYRS